MSDIEEPPSKILKMEQAPPSIDSTEEGQEEWLSEGLLTDDDYTDYPVDTKGQDKSDNTSQENDDTMQSTLDDPTDPATNAEGFQEASAKTSDAGIEETLKTLESSGQLKQDDTRFSDDLDQFLIRKVDGKLASVRADDDEDKKKDDNDDSDGNSTDDLLRMLEEDSGRTKKVAAKSVEKSQAAAATSDDDDEDLFRGGRKTRAQAAKSIMAKVATKAEPEDTTDTDSSSDEASVIKNIFVQKQQAKQSKPAGSGSVKPPSQPGKPVSRGNYAAKSTAKPSVPQSVQKTTKPSSMTKGVSGNDTKGTSSMAKFAHSTPLIIKNSRKSASKPETAKINFTPVRETRQTVKIDLKQAQNKLPSVNKSQVSKAQPSKAQTSNAQPSKAQTSKVQAIKAQTSKAQTSKPQTSKAQSGRPSQSQQIKPESSSKPKFKPKSHEPDEIINEEFLEDEEDFDLTEPTDLTDEKVAKKSGQKLMKPEAMDEEVPSDADSVSEGGSIYEELPTSDSESEEDWFTIDVRGERAGEYLTLLGESAGRLLAEEKERVGQRLVSIKQSLAALARSGREQSDQLNAATAELTELEAMLAAA